ncbi:MAG: class I SAM-dependent methyltransferase, partial [Atopobiaceae bacterium]|nr:class I SAM-dependent methyltransferase [Atopobiaceae bacterium]
MDAEGEKTLRIDGVVGVVRSLAGVQRADGVHLGVRQLEAKDVEVGLDALRTRGLGQHHEALLHLEAQHDLPGILAVLDLTPKMIEVATDKGIEGACFVVGDAEDLPFDDGSFDVVICANSFHH